MGILILSQKPHVNFYPFVLIWVPSESETETLWGTTQALDQFPLEIFFNIENEYTSSLCKSHLFWISVIHKPNWIPTGSKY